MEAQKSQPEKQPSPAAAVIPSCHTKKNDDAAFLEDLKDHINEFIHASMDEHKNCFQKTLKKVESLFQLDATYSIPQTCFFIAFPVCTCTNCLVHIQFQMFGMSKIVAERSSETKEVVSSLPLQTTVSD